MSGWIKLHRSLLDWEWYDDPNTLRLLIHLLITVNHEPTRYRGQEIPAGSRVAGRMALSRELGLSEKAIRTALDKLKTANEVAVQASNQFSIISMTKWDQMQSQGPAERPANGQPRATPAANQGPHLKKERKEEDKKPIAVTIPDWLPLADWEAFVLMRKKDKAPFTDRAAELTIGKLDELRAAGNDPARVLQQSIMRGWKGVFELKPEDRTTARSGLVDISALPEWKQTLAKAIGPETVQRWLNEARLEDQVLFVEKPTGVQYLNNHHWQAIRAAGIREVRAA